MVIRRQRCAGRPPNCDWTFRGIEPAPSSRCRFPSISEIPDFDEKILALYAKRVYGPQADTLDPRQLSLFDDPPADNLPASAPPPEPDLITATVKKNGHGRRKLPEKLKRETEIVDVPESVKQATGGAWQRIIATCQQFGVNAWTWL